MQLAGLLLFSLIISDIIERFTDADTVIMGDVSHAMHTTDSVSLQLISFVVFR